MQALVEGLEIDLCGVPSLASGFGAGMGGSIHNTCGALSGAIIVAGALLGRDVTPDHPPLAFLLSQELVAGFEDQFGTAVCCDLVGFDRDISYEEFGNLYRLRESRSNVCNGLIDFTIRRFYTLLDT